MHGQRTWQPYPAELPGGAAAGGGGSSTATLLVTVTATAAGPIALSNASFTPIVSAPSVAVAAGQKVLIWTTVEYDGGASEAGANTVTQRIRDATPTVYDNPQQDVEPGSPSHEIVARSIELTGLAAGNYVFTVDGELANGAPTVSAVKASIIVMVVSV